MTAVNGSYQGCCQEGKRFLLACQIYRIFWRIWNYICIRKSEYPIWKRNYFNFRTLVRKWEHFLLCLKMGWRTLVNFDKQIFPNENMSGDQWRHSYRGGTELQPPGSTTTATQSSAEERIAGEWRRNALEALKNCFRTRIEEEKSSMSKSQARHICIN